VVLDGDAPVFSGDGERVDEMRWDETTSNPWSARSISSWRGEEWRLEVRQAEVSFSSMRAHRSAAKVRTSEGVLEHGEEHGPRKGGATSLQRPNRRNYGGGHGGFR
jgi:hypothetical protein